MEMDYMHNRQLTVPAASWLISYCQKHVRNPFANLVLNDGHREDWARNKLDHVLQIRGAVPLGLQSVAALELKESMTRRSRQDQRPLALVGLHVECHFRPH